MALIILERILMPLRLLKIWSSKRIRGIWFWRHIWQIILHIISNRKKKEFWRVTPLYFYFAVCGLPILFGSCVLTSGKHARKVGICARCFSDIKSWGLPSPV